MSITIRGKPWPASPSDLSETLAACSSAVTIDELVLQDDFKGIELHHQRKIIRTIRERLGTEPEKYGEPLRGELKGYWKLRLGEFRVIYEIRKKEVAVLVVKVGLRRNDEVYRAMLPRLLRK